MDDITKLRLYLNDKEGKIFSDDELELLLADEGCVYCAASEGWTLMATKLDIGGTKKYTVGVETYEKSSINDQLKAALNNAEYFKGKCTCNINGSFILKASTRM